jgi:hypothetical protein
MLLLRRCRLIIGTLRRGPRPSPDPLNEHAEQLVQCAEVQLQRMLRKNMDKLGPYAQRVKHLVR